ncbi:unnamed protein product, partial [Adineta ricciae]
GVQIDQDNTGKTLRSSVITSSTSIAPSLLSSSISNKTSSTTTAPNTRLGSNPTIMVASSTLVPPTIDAKPSSPSSSSPSSSTVTLQTRKDSNASSSGAFSEPSRSFGREENSSDSLFSPIAATAAHLVIKCNVNPSSSTSTPSVTLTPRVKVTVQQPSITSRPSRFDSSPENITPSSSHLKTPTSNTIPIMSTSTTSSAPEFSLSGASSVDDSDDLALYDQYLSSHGRQSNPSPELRKKNFDDWIKLEQRYLPRSKSEINTGPTEQSPQQNTTSQIKPVSNTRPDVLRLKHVRQKNALLTNLLIRKLFRC